MSTDDSPEANGARTRVRGLFRRLGRGPRRSPRALGVRIALAALAIGAAGPLLLTAAWRVVDPPFTWLMVERMGEGETLARRPVRIDAISPHLVRAVIAAEDARFCSHDGFDIEAIQKALKHNAEQSGEKRRVRGGSTISQQTAKNLFLWADRSWLRKGLEAYFTVLIEAFWPKRRIMEAYLNAAEWGDGRFGAEAAAQQLFGKSAADLTPREAARLAAVLPSPNKWSADKPGPYVRRRAATILARMEAVKAQKLDLCVLDPKAPAPEPPPRERERDRAPRGEEALAPLPPPPELGPEADPLADIPQLAPLPEEGAPLEGVALDPIAPEAEMESAASAEAETAPTEPEPGLQAEEASEPLDPVSSESPIN